MYLSQNLLLQYRNVLINERVKQMRALNKEKQTNKKNAFPHLLLDYSV